MKNNIKYIKNILKALIWPIIFIIGQFFIRYIFVSIFNSREKGNLSNSEFLKYIKTSEYIEKLNSYINDKAIVIMLITIIIFIPIFLIVIKKYKNKFELKLKDIFIPILLGISISLIYNISLFNLNEIIYFTDQFQISPLPILVQIICTGICGPVLEEFLFRGIVYNKLKEFNKPMTAIILCSVIFGIIHTSLLNAIYAFGASFMFIYLYEKYKTLIAPILMHITLNTTTILILGLIIKNYFVINFILLTFSILILIILKKFIKKDV